MALLAAGRSSEAVALLKQATSDNPNGVMYYHLALAHYKSDDRRAAAQALKTAHDGHQLRSSQIPSIERDQYDELVSSLGVLGAGRR